MSTDDGARSEEAARDIEALRSHLADVTQQSEEIAARDRELERKVAHWSLNSSNIVALWTRTRELGAGGASDSSTRKVNELESEVARLQQA